jgi:hypothetical protein
MECRRSGPLCGNSMPHPCHARGVYWLLEVAVRIAGLLVLLSTLAFSLQAASPFSVVEVTRQFDSAGNVTSEARFLFAMNRDASIASVDLSAGATPTRQVIDVINHRTAVVNPQSRTAAILPYGAPQLASTGMCEDRFRRMYGAVVSVDRAAGTVDGVPLQRISVVLPGDNALEILVAPSLGCHMLETQGRRNGVLVETQTFESLRLADPDPRLFEVPAGYSLTQPTPNR